MTFSVKLIRFVFFLMLSLGVSGLCVSYSYADAGHSYYLKKKKKDSRRERPDPRYTAPKVTKSVTNPMTCTAKDRENYQRAQEIVQRGLKMSADDEAHHDPEKMEELAKMNAFLTNNAKTIGRLYSKCSSSVGTQ